MSEPVAIVFTDLDGTLLDHHDYDYSAATSALNLLKSLNIPVILASSKTAAEIAPLRAELGLAAHPAIVENGAGILPAGADATPLAGGDYARLRAALSAVPAEIRKYYKGFGDMSQVEVAAETGLPLGQAGLAQRRAFSEPGVWAGSDENMTDFLTALSTQGISARMGGRYLTLSYGKTKADQMATICNHYGNPPVIALGDAPNDVEMLMAADYPVLIPNPQARPLTGLDPAQQARLIHSPYPGPKGWNHSVTNIVNILK